MTDQQKNLEVDKEKEAKIPEEALSPVGEIGSEKRVGTSAILSFALFIAITYTVLLLLGLFSMGAWAGGFLYFLESI